METISVPAVSMAFERGQSKKIKIYILRHEDDKSQFNSLYNHLSVLRKEKILVYYLDAPGGGTLHSFLRSQFDTMDVVILFLSSSFENMYNHKEILDLLNEFFLKGVHIWPIIMKPYLWEISAFCPFPIFFGAEKPIASSNAPEETFTRLTAKIGSEVILMLANKWVKEGDRYVHQGHFQDALLSYQESLHYIPEYPPAIFGRGRALKKMNNFIEANEMFNSILNPRPQNTSEKKGTFLTADRTVLELICMCYKGHTLLELGRLEEALIEFRQARSLLSGSKNIWQKQLSAEVSCGEGNMYQRLNRQVSDLEKGLQCYSQAREADPNNIIYGDRIGQMLLLLGIRSRSHNFYERAQETYQQLLDDHPQSALGYVGLGDSMYHLQQYESALDSYEQAIQLDSYESRAYSGKGYVFLATQKPQEALDAFDSALALNPDNASYLSGKAQALASLDRYREALEWYERADKGSLYTSAAYFSRYAETLEALGNIALRSDQPIQANSFFERALRCYQTSSKYGGLERDIHFGYGKIYFAQKKWNMAQICFHNAISCDATMAEAYLEMAKVFIELKDTTNAEKYFTDAKQYVLVLGSKVEEADIEIALGDAFYQTVKSSYPHMDEDVLKRARSHYEQANTNRGHPLAYMGLGKLSIVCGSYKEASDAFTKALELQPQLIECYFLQGTCYYEMWHYFKAHDRYKIYQKKFSSNSDSLPLAFQKALSDVLLVTKQYREAIEVFDTIISRIQENEKMRKELADTYNSKAMALYGLESAEEALECLDSAFRVDNSVRWQPQYRSTLQNVYFLFEKALCSNPNDASLHTRVGRVFILMGKPEDAIASYTKAVVSSNKKASVYRWRGYAYERCQEYKKAFDDYCEVLRLDPDDEWAFLKKEELAKKLKESASETRKFPSNFFKRLIPGLD